MHNFFKKFLSFVIALSLLCISIFGEIPFLSNIAYAAAVSWTGGSGDWCTDANWSSGVEPTSSDDVTISATVSVTTSGCVTEGHTLNFSGLTVGGGAGASSLTITANIGTGGGIIISNNGTITQNNATTQTISGTLLIESEGNLTHTDNTTEASGSPSYAVKISAATITINSGGYINVDGKGNTGGTYRQPGNGTGAGVHGSLDDGSGGAHGGNGGNDSQVDAGGGAYCDITSPGTIGSGGGGGYDNSPADTGGDGGGLVVLTATGTITIAGTITADGAAGVGGGTDFAGGGAGGGVKITADTIAGSGTPSITVTGGNAGGSGGGDGGGGCVYLGYTTSNNFAATAITMNGGTAGYQKGGAGIVYIKQSGTSGDLYLTNGGTAGAASSQGASSVTAATLTLKSEAEYRVASGKTLVLNSGGNDPLSGGDATGVLRIDDSGIFTPNATLSVTGATLEKHQSATMNNATTLTIGSNGTLDMRDYTTSLAFSTTTLTVNSGGTITHGDNTTEVSASPSHTVNISATTITINSGGYINVDGKGNTGGTYRQNGNGTGPGLFGSSVDGSGGGHGGNGGNDNQSDAGGTAYCDITNPGSIGSGGAGGYDNTAAASGGDGGGLIILTATGTITIAGTITADGAVGGTSGGYHAGGGAGGGVKITADTIAGSGTPSITVTGGNAGGSNGGGGGGGCAYLRYTTSNNFAATSITMNGGTTGNQVGGAGIAYIKQTGTSGDLYLTNGGTAGAASTQGATYVTAATLTLKSEAELTIGSTKTLVLDSAGNDPLSGGDGTGVLRIDDGATFTPNATFGITGATLELHQSATFNNASALGIGSNGTLDMRDFTTSLALSKTTVTVNSGGTITHGDNAAEVSNAPSHTVNISATTITINSGGYINVDGKGNTGGTYRQPGNGTGAGVYGSADDGSGGAHSGNGGNDSQGNAGGTAYCDITSPATIGSGGGGGYDNSLSGSGGDGGGLVVLTATGTITIAGTITADGAAGAAYSSYHAGGGAGGALNATGSSVVFSGSITATGGSAGGAGGGAGGGGCAYIAYSSSYDNTGSSNSVVAGTTGGAGGVGSFLTAQTNTAPTVVINSAAQKTAGTGTVDLSITADDADNNDTLKAKLEYKAGADCSSGTSDPTLDEDDANTTSTYGDPKVENDNEYQVGNSSGWITTSSGANTVLFDWLAETDLPTADGTYCVKITPQDGTAAGTAQTTTLTLDNVNPTSAGNLTLNTIATDSLTFTLGAAGVDTNLNQYKIYYKAGASGVLESDTLHSTILSGAYVGGNTTQIGTLSANTQYVANIWTYDSYGNKSSATEIAKYTAANIPSAPTVTASSTTGLTVVINQNSNPSNTTYAIKVGTQHVQADGTLGAGEVWQTYTTWGGATGQIVSGLSANTQYAVSVKAKNGDGTETSLSSETSKYTLASAVTGITLANATTKSAYGLSLSWTNNGQNGVKIDLSSVSAGACDDTYDINDYDNVSSNPASPRSISASTYTCYKARISSYNGDGVLNSTDVATSSGITTPTAQPTSLAKTDADINYITWSWTGVTNATNYKIYRDSDDAYIGQTGGETTSYTQTTVTDGGATLSANTQYTVYVRAENANGEGIASSSASSYTETNLPSSLGHDAASQTTSAMRWTWSSGGTQKDFYAYMDSPYVNSGYITDTFWNVSELSTNTNYSFYVQARNESDVLTNTVSNSAYTAQGTPSGITFSDVATDSITVTAEGDFANLTTASSGVRFQNTTTAADNTFTTNSWVNGSLDINTQYTYVVSAKNGDGDETSTVTDAEYTLANVPSAPTVTTESMTSLTVVINQNSNPSNTTYAIKVGTQYVQADGTLGDSEVWQTYTTWGGATGQIVSGLSANTQYAVSVKAKNGNGTETSFSDSVSKYTPISVTGVTLENTTTKNAYGINLSWINALQSGVKIDLSSVENGACDSTYDVADYDNALLTPDFPRSILVIGNTCYRARILSYNGDGVLNTSDEAVSNELTTPPTQPTGLAKTTATSGSITWGWTEVTGATNYKIYRDSDDAYIGQTSGVTTSYEQTTTIDGGESLSADTQYTVYVRAENANGEGIASSSVSANTSVNAIVQNGGGSAIIIFLSPPPRIVPSPEIIPKTEDPKKEEIKEELKKEELKEELKEEQKEEPKKEELKKETRKEEMPSEKQEVKTELDEIIERISSPSKSIDFPAINTNRIYSDSAYTKAVLTVILNDRKECSGDKTNECLKKVYGLDKVTDKQLGDAIVFNKKPGEKVTAPRIVNLHGTIGSNPAVLVVSKPNDNVFIKISAEIEKNGEKQSTPLMTIGGYTDAEGKGVFKLSSPLSSGNYSAEIYATRENKTNSGNKTSFTVSKQVDKDFYISGLKVVEESSPALTTQPNKFIKVFSSYIEIGKLIGKLSTYIGEKIDYFKTGGKVYYVEGNIKSTDKENAMVYLTYKSVIFGSVVISDAGKFKSKISKEIVSGDHTLTAYGYNPKADKSSSLATTTVTKK